MLTKMKLAAAAVAFLGIGGLAAPEAKADLAIMVSPSSAPGGGAATIYDQQTASLTNPFSDGNPAVGAVTFIDAGSSLNLGGLQFTATTGNGSPSIGSPAFPDLRITSSGATTGTPPTSITVTVSENNLTAAGIQAFLLSADAIFAAVDTPPLSTAVYTYYLDNSNTLFGMGVGTQIGTATLTNTAPAQSTNQVVTANPDGSFSLTVQIVLTGVDAGQPFQIAAGTTAVPEPASLALFGASLLGLGLFGRRRRA